jgi:hypothetical protein
MFGKKKFEAFAAAELLAIHFRERELTDRLRYLEETMRLVLEKLDVKKVTFPEETMLITNEQKGYNSKKK